MGTAFRRAWEEHPLAPDSVSPVLPEHQGWFHVATVYDVITKTVRFYLNGRFDNEVQQADRPSGGFLAQLRSAIGMAVIAS